MTTPRETDRECARRLLSARGVSTSPKSQLVGSVAEGIAAGREAERREWVKWLESFFGPDEYALSQCHNSEGYPDKETR